MSEDLLLYAQLGRADHIARLIKEGADPDWRREDGVTTLMMAAMTGRIEVMVSLLDNGATVDLQAPDGTTAFGLVEAVIALLKAGADPLHKNRYGTTALMQAARGHLVETVRVLIRAGSDRGQQDESGLNASRYANELGPPPMELKAVLAPSDLGSLELSRRVSKFDRPDFRISLLGSWNESSDSPDAYEFLEVTGERQIFVTISHLPAELDPDERQDAINRQAREHMASIRLEAGDDCQFTEVRFFEANNVVQARWSGLSPANSFFVAACIYATATRFVTMAYRDFRPNLSEETRGRQASESVASFRVK